MLSAKIETIKPVNLFINKKCLKTQTKDVEMNDFFSNASSTEIK